ncbi:hypothetical protein [Tahibacter harae]|uniref:Peptidoglycan binding protein n=1 Tax=Tahibacter harae TaxID=2963937 RepID=A0ABT1QWW4_9GAMM|nr:hypothetical protein [Tahibacter harae]MCQ4166765.1 hypothetical protein [Tahibacter harae]
MIRVMLVAAALVLTGCAGVFNPYVKPELDQRRLFEVPADPADRSGANLGCAELEPQLCEALLLAEGYRLAYLRAAANQQKFRSGIALTGLAAATATLYYGLSGREVFKDRVLRLGTLGAASYATGTYFSSSPRQQVYLHGATAMSCAVIAAAPLMVPRGRAAALRDDLARLAGALASDSERSRSVTASAKMLDAIAAGENAYRDGTVMQANLLRSGFVLHARIALLANEVNKQVLAQLPDLASLYALAGSMSGFAQGFGSGRLAAPAAVPAPDGATPADLAARGMNVRGSDKSDPSRELLDATAAVQQHLQFASVAAQSFDEVGACNPDGIADNFKVEPGDATVTVEAGKTFDFLVTDERGHPSAKLSGDSVGNVELQPVHSIEDNSSKYKVVVKGRKATGSKGPTLLIRESNGVKVVAVTVMVSAPAAPADADDAPAAPAKNSPAAPRAGEDAGFLQNPLHILAVQCTVGAEKPDCLMGRKTRAAIKAYKERINPGTPQDDSADAALLALAGKRKLDIAACSAKTYDCGEP